MTAACLEPRRGPSTSDKILRSHLDSLAIVYVRQSTVQEVERHQESTRLQCGLVDRALNLGWLRALDSPPGFVMIASVNGAQSADNNASTVRFVQEIVRHPANAGSGGKITCHKTFVYPRVFFCSRVESSQQPLSDCKRPYNTPPEPRPLPIFLSKRAPS